MNKFLTKNLKLLILFIFIGTLLWFAHPTPTLFVMGLVLILLGEGIRFWAAGHMRRNEKLITSGPYAHCRNPLYLGRFLLLNGICLITGYWYLIPPALTILGSYTLLRMVPREENRLRQLFGNQFDEWAPHVPAFFPRLTPYPLNPQPWNLRVMIESNKEYWMVLAEFAIVSYLLLRLWK